MNGLGLTASQKAFRTRVLGGSDANTIMSGDRERINRLWSDKRGITQPENLDSVLLVRMGQWTEEFNRIWFTEQTGRVVTAIGEERLSIDNAFMACTLDGLTDGDACVFEAKHVNAFSKEPEVFARYQPQLHHNMIVCGVERAVLSVFLGTQKYAVMDVEFDAIYGAALMDAERQFWACVESGQPPHPIQFVEAPAVKALRVVDMTGSNEWAASADDWLKNKAAAKHFESAAKSIKSAMEADMAEAFGHGIVAKRNAAGSITISART